MARVRLTKTHSINGKQVKAGSFVCDGTSCNAGDFIWTGLNAAAYSNAMVAIDAGAITIQAASRFTVNPAPGFISGADSIEG
jgi:hypothetical protein